MPDIDGKVEINPKRDLSRGEESIYVSMQDLNEYERTITSHGRREYTGSGSRFKNGDTLFARITPCLENGKTAYVDFLKDGEVAHGSTEFIVLTGKDENSDPLFVYYLSRSPDFRAYAIARMEGSSGRQRVPAKTLKNYSYKLPGIQEQHKIAHILGTLDDKIELNRRMNATLEEMAQALFKSWFVDFDPVIDNALRAGNHIPDELADRAATRKEMLDSGKATHNPEIHPLFPDSFQDSKLGPIPEGWEVKPIGELLNCVGGGTPSTKNPDYWKNGKNPFLTPKDMSSLESHVLIKTERHITDYGVEKISSKQIPTGSVILSSRAPIGYLAINEIPVSINQGIIAMICDTKLPNHYVLYWTKTNMDIIKAKAGGTTFAEISKKNFRPIPAILPSKNPLKAFVNHLGCLHENIVKNIFIKETLAETRDNLLPKLISGELQMQ